MSKIRGRYARTSGKKGGSGRVKLQSLLSKRWSFGYVNLRNKRSQKKHLVFNENELATKRLEETDEDKKQQQRQEFVSWLN